MALKRLFKELKQYNDDMNPYYSIGVDDKNMFTWNIMMIIPDPDSPYFESTLDCMMTFPPTYPNKPPEFKFLTKIFHPNVYPDGKVCISILHEGKDEYGYEDVSLRWNPSRSIDSILMSIITMISDPNTESPANVDASVMFKNERDKYNKIVYSIVATINFSAFLTYFASLIVLYLCVDLLDQLPDYISGIARQLLEGGGTATGSGESAVKSGTENVKGAVGMDEASVQRRKAWASSTGNR
jgi:ubiquitin-conjugating enzyme E2 G1